MKKREDKPLVSIIVPTFNSQKTIKQCLQSTKNQTYKEIEVIVVDRHSKDKTLEIASQFKTRQLSVTQERSTAKNYAANEAKGDYLLFIDSDMTLSSTTVEACVSASLSMNLDAVVIPLKSVSNNLLGECRKIERDSLADFRDFMEAARFFKKSAFLQAEGFDEKIVCGEDFDLFKRFKEMGFKFSRITPEIFHLEGSPSLQSVVIKGYYYGKTLPALVKKEPSETVKRYAKIRFASIKTTGKVFRRGELLFSFIVMKVLEYAAYFLGLLVQLFILSFGNRFFKTFRQKFLSNKLLITNCAILILISFAIFRNFLFSAEWPGGGDVMGFVSRAYLYGRDFRWLYTWRLYSFGFVEGINFMDFFFMAIYSIFRDPSWTVKIFLFLSYLAAASSMYLFAYRYIKSHVAAFSASLVYVLNQWLFSQLTEAHVDIVFSYALAPFIFVLLDRALKNGRLRDIVLLSLGLGLFFTSFHPECIVIYGVFVTLFAIFFLFFPSKFETFKERFSRTIRVFVPSALLTFLLSSFFFIPFLANVQAPYFHSSYTYFLEDAFGHSYTNITDAFTLRAVEKWGYVNLVDVYSGLGLPDFPVNTFLFWIFLLSYCILLIRRDRYTLFFAFSMLISVFLSKGPYPPFGGIFVWAWSNIPHFAVFRAANRWVVMAIFSHAFFVSLLVYYLTRFIRKISARTDEKYLFKIKVRSRKLSKATRLAVSVDSFNSFSKSVRKFFYVLGIILLTFIFLSGFFSCYFFFSQGLQVYTPPEEYLTVYEWLATQPTDHKVITVCRSHSEWLDPSSGESDFASSGMATPLGWSHDIGFDSSFIHDKPILQNGGWDLKAREFLDYLRFRLARGHLTDNFLKMVGPFAYDYVVIPSYITDQTRQFFLNQEGYRVVYNQSALVLRNNYVAPRLYAANQTMVIMGGFESFEALCKIESFDLGKTTLFYVPESVDDDVLFYERLNQSQMLCFENSKILDLAMISLGEKATVIHASDYGFSSLDTTKYWAKCPSWRILGAFVLGEDILTTIGKNNVDIPFEIDSDGHYNIFLRIGFAPSRGILSLYVDGEFVQEVCPYFPLMSKIEWINMASLKLSKGRHVITLENDGTGFNDVDAIAIVKPSDLESQVNEIISNLQGFQGRLLYLMEAENIFLNSSNSDWHWAVSPYNGYIIRSESYGSNIAVLARANATSECEFMEAPNVIDGDLDTRWTSEKYVLPQWLELEWDTTQRLHGLRIVFENAYATDYAMQTWNGTHWINQTIVTGNSEFERLHNFPEVVETNKLRVYVTGFSNFYRVSVWELEVYSAEITSALSNVIIPREGNYMLAARVGMGPAYGDICFKVNNSISALRCNDSDTRFEWREMGPFLLTAGNTSIGVGGVGLVELDEIMLYSLEDQENYLSLDELFNSSSPKVLVNYEQINPCKFRVHVNASEPFILVFSDTYDPLWLAFDGEKTISSTRAFALVNSFKIDKIGEFDIVVSFEGQTYVDVGLVVSFLTLVSIPVGFLIYRIGVRRFKKRVASWRKGSWLLKIRRR